MEFGNNESVAVYAMRLKQQAEQCNFGDKLEEHVRDQIIEKCRSVVLRREMLKQGDANLQTILTTAKVLSQFRNKRKCLQIQSQQ